MYNGLRGHIYSLLLPRQLLQTCRLKTHLSTASKALAQLSHVLCFRVSLGCTSGICWGCGLIRGSTGEAPLSFWQFSEAEGLRLLFLTGSWPGFQRPPRPVAFSGFGTYYMAACLSRGGRESLSSVYAGEAVICTVP